ncbi:UNVERIFIED_CONTAM: Retrovirus-related Pol polyprotein from transposon RE2 [Sesamum angustifolium]|uniref:Retrovirus-related Pol polyprotein from transposon RE2 n=1 Tax=Sesamum angustifolium TaxID=2727405 RepID=A0AAW2M8V8_9LAMI
MEEEIKMIEKNNTWELADRPKDKEVIGVKWIYKKKLNADGSIQKHKARLVAKGYSQLPEIYVEQPQGFIAKSSEEKVLRLKKALYGLKQAPRAWYSRIDKYFMDRGFWRSLSEPTLYIKSQGIFSWASKKQATVAQSSAEAEYIAAVATSNQAIWLRRILEDMGEKQEEPTTIYCDNKSAIAITKNPVQHSRTKHIDIKYHSLREATTEERLNSSTAALKSN